MALPEQDRQRPIILIGYSKGAADVLHAVSKYPREVLLEAILRCVEEDLKKLNENNLL